MKELQTFRGHKREVMSLAWHPIHEDFFASGGYDGSIEFWLVGNTNPVGEIVGAHENSVRFFFLHAVSCCRFGHLLGTQWATF